MTNIVKVALGKAGVIGAVRAPSSLVQWVAQTASILSGSGGAYAKSCPSPVFLD